MAAILQRQNTICLKIFVSWLGQKYYFDDKMRETDDIIIYFVYFCINQKGRDAVLLNAANILWICGWMCNDEALNYNSQWRNHGRIILSINSCTYKVFTCVIDKLLFLSTEWFIFWNCRLNKLSPSVLY